MVAGRRAPRKMELTLQTPALRFDELCWGWYWSASCAWWGARWVGCGGGACENDAAELLLSDALEPSESAEKPWWRPCGSPDETRSIEAEEGRVAIAPASKGVLVLSSYSVSSERVERGNGRGFDASGKGCRGKGKEPKEGGGRKEDERVAWVQIKIRSLCLVIGPCPSSASGKAALLGWPERGTESAHGEGQRSEGRERAGLLLADDAGYQIP